MKTILIVNGLSETLVNELETLRQKALYTNSKSEIEKILKATEIQHDVFRELERRGLLTYHEHKLARAINISIMAICRIRKEMESK